MNEKNNTETLVVRDWDSFPKAADSNIKSSPSSVDFENPNNQSTLHGSLLNSNALNFLIQLYRTCEGNVAAEEKKKLVTTFSTKIIDMCAKTEAETKEPLLKLDEFSCSICFGVVSEPLTIRCGHTYCKKCLQKELQGGQCKQCPLKFTEADVISTKPNVLLMSLTEKLWPNGAKTASLRTEGNSLCVANKHNEALSKYTEALKLCPTDHLTLSNRSHVLFTLGNSEDALLDAEASIKHCPYWFKGYFRKAVTLASLGRYAESFSNLGLCVYLVKATKYDNDAALGPIKSEMFKVLNKLFPSNQNYVQTSLRRHTLDHSLFSPYPSQKKVCVRNDRQRGFPWNESECNSSGDEGDSNIKESSNVVRNSRHSNFHCIKGNSIASAVGYDQTFVRMERLFSQAMQDITAFEKRLKSIPSSSRSIEKALVLSSDFECSLCYRLLYQPVTTPCGHTYCRSCLERCIDHSPTCPLCKTSLVMYLNRLVFYKRPAITYALEILISKYLSKDYADRVNQHLEELEENIASDKNKEEIPIFVCTMAFPTVPCPLHVFEPRYRLMIRRCMESGSKRFGMCCYLQEGDHNYGDFGTLLEVKSVQYFPDGRSIVDTIGIRRFKVIKKFMKDGYNTASVEFVQDRPVEQIEREKLKESHDKVFKEANLWLQSINPILRQRICTHFGAMPAPEEETPEGPKWIWWLLAILPLDAKAQLAILSMNSLQRRLSSILKVLTFVRYREL